MSDPLSRFPADFPYQVELEQAKADSDRNFAALTEAHPWLENLAELGQAAIARVDKPTGFRKLVILADRVNQATADFVACKKGCAQCCHIAAVITEVEAKILAKAGGRKMAKVRKTGNREALVKKYFGVPCPFLKDNACSVYEHRPITCRTHTNLASTAFFCNTVIKPEWSFVPSVNMSRFNMAYGWLLRQEVAADIRDFFPPD